MTTESAEMKEARETYFAAGGLESDLGPRADPNWYWRRAAKLLAIRVAGLSSELQSTRDGEKAAISRVRKFARTEIDKWKAELANQSSARAPASETTVDEFEIENAESIAYVRECLEFRIDAYLRKKGWKSTCDVPGSFWLLEREINGNRILVSKSSAVNIQQHLEAWEDES